MNLDIGRMPHGKRNLITDVPGVRVGHTTIDRENCHTGVTVVLPPLTATILPCALMVAIDSSAEV